MQMWANMKSLRSLAFQPFPLFRVKSDKLKLSEKYKFKINVSQADPHQMQSFSWLHSTVFLSTSTAGYCLSQCVVQNTVFM